MSGQLMAKPRVGLTCDNLVSGNAPYRVAPSSASPRKFDENRLNNVYNVSRIWNNEYPI